jgi:radical SAM protein with 4Fe4S-binding SPASM domain
MPAYNRANLITKAIDSVLSQTLQDFTLLIIDDGSEDNLHEVVAPYLSDKVVYYRIPHSGPSAARNFGLAKSRYPYLAYLDTDNQWHPDYLKTMADVLVGNGSSHEAAYCQADIFKKNPQTNQICHEGVIGQPFNYKELVRGNYIDINMFVHSQKALRYAGTYDNLERLGDWDFILRITSLFEPVFVPEVLVDYYLGIAQNAITSTRSFEKSDYLIRKKTRKYREPVTIVHDTIPYTWQMLPEKKYRNWVRMQQAKKHNTDDYTAWGYPYVLQIEPTNRCNLSCEICPVARKILNRKSRDMTFSEFKSIIDDMQDYLLLAVLWDWGEPFMNPELPKMIAYATEKDIRTITSTNAHFLNDSAFNEAILKAGLSTLIIAMDSLEQTTYTRFRKKGHLETVQRGLDNLIAVKHRIGSDTKIHIRMVVTRHNEHEIGKMRRFAKKIGADWFSVKTLNDNLDPHARPEDIEPRNPHYRRYIYKPGSWERIRSDRSCEYIWNIANINTNGDVVGCCYDYDASMKMGNVFERPFTQIWNGPEFTEFRKTVLNDRSAFPKCVACGVHYEISKRGWYPVFTSLKEAPREQLQKQLKRFKKIRKDIRSIPTFKVFKKARRRIFSAFKLF